MPESAVSGQLLTGGCGAQKTLRAAILALALLLGGGSAARADDDFNVGALKAETPPSLAGKVTGILWQEEQGGPLRFTVDSLVVPNVYFQDKSQAKAATFQVDAKGDKISLKTGFRSLTPADLGPDRPHYALVELEINQGRGMQGLNGFLITGLHRLGKGLDARMAFLNKDVDHIAAGYQKPIAAFFTQKEKGRDLHLVQPTWLSQTHAIQVRQARSVTGQFWDRPKRGGPRRHVWAVPYLTVLYQLKEDGKLITRTIVAPQDPLATAKKYNPVGSPW